MEQIILVGFGGHAKSVIDCMEASGQYEIVGYTDPAADSGYRGYRCLGTDEVLQRYYDEGVANAFVSVGYMGKGDLRLRLYRLLKTIGYTLPSIIDPAAAVAADAVIGEGCFVGKNAVINASTTVGEMCIVNSGAIVEHDCAVGGFSHIAVGAVLCGNVRVGRAAFIGANATVIQGRNVGDGCIIGAGEVLRQDLEGKHMFSRNTVQKISGGGVKEYKFICFYYIANHSCHYKRRI